MDYGLGGRVAWITGAGGALGAAIARTLADEGAVTWLSGRNAGTLDATAAAIAATRPDAAHVLPMDVSRRDAVDAAANRIIATHGRIDILVNSTALPIFGAFLELADDDW